MIATAGYGGLGGFSWFIGSGAADRGARRRRARRPQRRVSAGVRRVAMANPPSRKWLKIKGVRRVTAG